MIELHDIKTAIDLADQLPDTKDSFRVSTTLMACGNEIESLRAENEALKQQVEQGKRDALLHAAKVIGLYDDATMQNDYMLDSCDCAEILIALAAAPKQEK